MNTDNIRESSVLITGASGFIGRYLSDYLKNDSRFFVKKASRQPMDECGSAFYLGISSDYSSFLRDVDVVVHLAAVAHDKNISPEILMELNHDATLNLAKQAASAGVKRFIFLSSVAVNGFCETEAITENSITYPIDNYAFSKSSAEQSLHALSEITAMEVVIVRSPMVYGVGAGGTFYQLLKFIEKGYPLPFGCIHNKRSFVYVENLVDFLTVCLSESSISGKTLLVSDDEVLSTSEFISEICQGFSLNRVELPIPFFLLNLLGRLTGREDQIKRLTSSLWIDSSLSRAVLNWVPPHSFKEAVGRMSAIHSKGESL